MGKYTSAKSFDDNSSELAQAPTDEQKDAASKVDVLQVQVRPTFLSRGPPAHSPVHRAALEVTASQMRCSIWSAHAGGLGSLAEHNGFHRRSWLRGVPHVPRVSKATARESANPLRVHALGLLSVPGIGWGLYPRVTPEPTNHTLPLHLEG